MLQPIGNFARPLTAFAAVLAALAAGCAENSSAPAGGFPNRTIVVICPWAAGGGTDRVARFLADQLQRELGSPVVVQNQTGGSGAAGHAAGARARPDGYTITMGTFELSTMRAMGISDLTYRDFEPLMQVNADPAAIIVRGDSPWQSLRELLDDIRARPGKLRMSGTSAGGAWDLARAGLLVEAGLPPDSVVWVPSQGSAPSLGELLGGHIEAVCCSVPEAQARLAAGELRVLCVMSRQRLPEHPAVPTTFDEGLAWEAVGWRGLFLPQDTPAEIRGLLAERLQAIVASREYAQFMDKNDFEIAVRSGDEFTSFLAEQEQRWHGVVTAAGYAADGGRSRVATNTDPGPWFFPAALVACLAVGTGLVAAGRVWKRIRLQVPAERPPTAASWLRFWREPGKLNVVLLLVALIAYLAALPWLGFFVSTQLFATAAMIRLGVTWWRAAAYSAVLLAAVYLLFVWQFRIVLPASPWWHF